METLCNYILMIYCEKYAYVQPLGSLISKTFFLVLIIALKAVFMDDEIKELPVRNSIMLVLIPIGSIEEAKYRPYEAEREEEVFSV